MTSARSVTNSRKRIWTDDERNVLAVLEIEALHLGDSGTMNVNRYIHQRHRGRTLEGIKAERRGSKYQNVLRLLRQPRAGVPSECVPLPVKLNMEAGVLQGEMGTPLIDPVAGTTGNASNVEVVFEHNRDQLQEENLVDPSIELRRKIEQGIELLSTKRKFLAPRLVRAAKAVLLDRSNMSPTMEWFTGIVGTKPPTRRTNRKGKKRNVKVQFVRHRPNKRSRDLMEYAKLQTLFRRAPKKAAKCILEGSKDVKSGPKEDAMFKFWEGIFGTDGITNGEQPDHGIGNNQITGEKVLAICGPISAQELLSSKPKRGTAAGPDGLVATRWRVIPEEWKMLYYNIILYAEALPKELVAARTIFVPKVDGPRYPSEYRPISITSVALRQFHTILARRLQHAFAHDERQRAFQCSVDGSAENIFLLNAILQDARDKKKELHLISLDLNKAFDSVHHTSILSTLKRKGCPTRFINHVNRVYSGASTVLQYNRQEHATQVKRGVLQGDPLSPSLFNYAIDEALASLNNSLGYLLGEQRISAIAFADDIILLSGSAQGLRFNLKAMTNALKSKGLTINRNKTTALSYVSVTFRKERRMAVNTTEPFELENLPIRQLGPTDEWKYLGTGFRGMFSCEIMSAKLAADVRKISKSKLKTQQKLCILKRHVLTKYMHSLVLGKTGMGLLNKVDVDIRKFTRWWLRFPNDVPVSYLHSTDRIGGLGVLSLSLEIPRMRLNRIQRFIDRDSDMSRALAGSSFAKNQVKTCRENLRRAGLVDATKQTLRAHWETQMRSTIDTAGLNPGDPASHKWLNHTAGMTSDEFVRLNHLRAGTLPTAARLARGRDGDTRCRWCRKSSETNYHVIQQCEGSEGGRRFRHNKVVNFMAKALSAKDLVFKEPRFETTNGLKIPDLIVVRDGIAWVMDVQIVNDDDMARHHLNKRQKYQMIPGLNSLILQRYDCTKVRHKPITISYKGVIHCETAAVLRIRFAIRETVLHSVSKMTLRGSYSNWASLKARTWTVSRRNPNFIPPT